jgi:dynein heavy chain 1
MRLFEDRIVKDEEKEWCEKLVDQIAVDCFPNINLQCLDRPILFTNYLSK